MNRTTMPESGEIKLEGEYPDHLQDVWREGGFIYWAHTLQLLKTDLSGRILARADVDEHHAGIEARDGKVYVAVCILPEKTGGKTLPDSRVTVNVYDADTLALLEEHVTDINDRSGSLCILDDGGLCLKLDKDFREVARYRFDGTVGLVFDRDSVWTGYSCYNPDTKTWTSGLRRVVPPAGFC